jgi:hypothetical protein
MVKFGYNLGICISILQLKAFSFCTFLSFFIESFLFTVISGNNIASLIAKDRRKYFYTAGVASSIRGNDIDKIYGIGGLNQSSQHK